MSRGRDGGSGDTKGARRMTGSTPPAGRSGKGRLSVNSGTSPASCYSILDS